MKEIPLTRGMVALVDDEDFDHLSQYKWHADKAHRTFYAARTSIEETRRRTVRMHQEILPTYKFVDHIDHNGLNNQKNSLRIAGRDENTRNTSAQVGATSKYLGVRKGDREGTWFASIGHLGKGNYLGTHTSEESAALAYNIKASELFGEFANLNILPEGTVIARLPDHRTNRDKVMAIKIELSKGTLTHKKIALLHGCSLNVVKNISSGTYWSSITMDSVQKSTSGE